MRYICTCGLLIYIYIPTTLLCPQQVLEDYVERLGQAGIYSILDCHQDLLSPKFCGKLFRQRMRERKRRKRGSERGGGGVGEV